MSAPAEASTAGGGVWLGLLKLLRVKQWSKGVFVMIGPVYAYADGHLPGAWSLVDAAWAMAGFALASSACYAFNDVRDAEADRQHPRKKRRPVASGVVSPGAALWLAGVLLVLSGLTLAMLPVLARLWVGGVLAVYVLNTLAYSVVLKHRVVADVMSLSMGFVLRVLAGCMAVGVGPSTYLLNVTFFLAMFLAFGKRLGERRTLGSDQATLARGVQAGYTDDTLRLAVIATAVVVLVSYAGYVLSRDADYVYTGGFNLLWLTMLPATYGLLRCVHLVENARYDDPTELATKDRPFQLSAIGFALLTGACMWAKSAGYLGKG
jgi:decaprenyl-phosphate phosphoribosyltransferase